MFSLPALVEIDSFLTQLLNLLRGDIDLSVFRLFDRGKTYSLDMNQDEAQFSVEAKLENQVYKWANKYKASFCLVYSRHFLISTF